MQQNNLKLPPAPSCLQQFGDWCDSHGDRVAILHNDDCISYAELDARSWQITNFLISNGATRGQRIGLCLDRSALAIAAMIGTMRAGAAFVPLDPEYPLDRLRYMVEDAEIGIIFCEPRYREFFRPMELAGSLRIIDPRCDQLTRDSRDASRQSRATAIDDDDVAYVMYTSGSTGNPKGVVIQHRALNTYCDADVDVYKLSELDRTLHFSTLNFDIAIEEIFPPLISGGAVVVRPTERSQSENELAEIIRKYEITALHLATAYWHEWVDLMAAAGERIPNSLRMVLATGEKVSPAHYQRWLSMCDHDVFWCNAYGPTETCVTSTVFIPPRDWNGDSMPIGKPLKRYTAHIIDANDVPLRIEQEKTVSETGDLYIGGPALAKGYLNLPEKTEAVFRTLDLGDGQGPVRIYKTGDLARWLPNGDIEFAGRIDHQIKLGSYRIEPGEIEFQLGNCPGVLESLITYDEVEGKKTLIAYLAVGGRPLRAIDVANYLKDRLPPYMIPSRYVFCGAFPKTINGKIDRAALPPANTSQIARRGEAELPRNDLERMLVDLWNDCLGVTQVGIHDDFFAIGGSSLLVTRVITGIRKRYQIAIPVRDFFANPTVASIASLLSKRLQIPTASQTNENSCRQLRDRLPSIDAFYFPCGQESLFAVRYPAMRNERMKRSDRGVLICPPDGHEYARSHRNLQQLAIQLAAAGIDTFRFDFSGCGNSSGDNRDGRIERWQEQIHTAVEQFRIRASLDSVTAIGLRLGATLLAQDIPRHVEQILLWDPVDSGDKYLNLLDHFQHRAMNDVTHYPVRRKSSIPQTFGVEMSAEKRSGYQRLKLQIDDRLRNIDHKVLFSHGYCEVEGIVNRFGAEFVFESQDEIYWHDWQYVHSAFSSPQISRRILESLGA